MASGNKRKLEKDETSFEEYSDVERMGETSKDETSFEEYTDVERIGKTSKVENISEEDSDIESTDEDLEMTYYLCFENLPDTALIHILGFLDFKDRCSAAYTCRRLYELLRSSSATGASNKLDVKYKTSNELLLLLLTVPQSKNLSIYCESFDEESSLWLPDIVSRIRERCPHIKVLIFENVSFTDEFLNTCGTTDHILNAIENYWDPSKQESTSHRNVSECQDECCDEMIHLNKYNPETFPKDLHTFSLRYAGNSTNHILPQLNQILPTIKVLDLTGTKNFLPAAIPYVHKLIYLEELYLTECLIINSDIDFLLQYLNGLKVLDMEGSSEVNDETFKILQKHGQSLEKLFLGSTDINPLYVLQRYNRLRKLKELCIRNNLSEADDYYILLRTSNDLVSINISYEYINWVLLNGCGIMTLCSTESRAEPVLCHHFKKNLNRRQHQQSSRDRLRFPFSFVENAIW